MPIVRPAIFHVQARAEIRALPKDVRFRLGRSLLALQYGYALGMPASRPMPAVAAGVNELRLHDPDAQYRVFYYAKATEGVMVLRAFHKKTARTPPPEIVIVRRRLKELMDEREKGRRA